MYYIFDKNNRCVCYCEYQPDCNDLTERGEFCVEESDSYTDHFPKLLFHNGNILIDSLTTEESLSEKERFRRDLLLLEVDKIVMNPVRYEDLSEKELSELKEYRKFLLDIPQQTTFPEKISWPTKPTILE